MDRYHGRLRSLPVRLVYVVVVLGVVLRLVLLALRPPAERHFTDLRRRRLARTVEHAGDAVFLVSTVLAVLAGRHAHVAVGLLCAIGVVLGLAMVALAYDVAQRHRPPGTAERSSRSGSDGGRHRAPPADERP